MYFNVQKYTNYINDFENIYIYGEIKEYEDYQNFIDKLKDQGVKVYTFNVNYNKDSISYEISKEYANRLVELNIIELIDANSTTISNEDNGKNFGSCNEIPIGYELVDCSKASIEVVDEQIIQLWFEDFFGTMYSSGIMTTHLFEYDDNLYDVVESTLDSTEMDQMFDVRLSSENHIAQQETVNFFVSRERQNIVAILVIILLQITLVAYHFMVSKHRSIAILSLLGYSRFKILFILAMIFSSTLILPYLILSYYGIQVINYYIIIDFIFVLLILFSMFLLLQKRFELKARERM